MKIAIIFGVGITVGLIFGFFFFRPPTASANEAGLETYLPDFGTFYANTFSSPFIEAEKKIWDPDIAQYYHHLLVNSGLNEITSRLPEQTTIK